MNANLSLIASAKRVVLNLSDGSQRIFKIDLSSQMHNDNLIMRLENINEEFELVLNIEEQNLTTVASAKKNQDQVRSIDPHRFDSDLELEEQPANTLLENIIPPRNIHATMILDQKTIYLLCAIEDYVVI
jgi:tRNA G18 (ribose-2'-O)-methylase SpoU